MTTLIKDCRLVSPGVDLAGASLELDGPRIKAVHQPGAPLPAAETVYECGGRMAVPGFIDMHFHGAMGCDTTDGKVESVETIAKAKLAEGATTICPTTLTLPEAQLTAAMQTVAAYAAAPRYAKVAGVHLEGPFINSECTGAQNPEYVRKPSVEEVDRLNGIARVAIVSFAVEAEGGTGFVRQMRERGIVPACGHSAATYADFESAYRAGLRQFTHFCNQMTKLHHREVGLVGAGLLHDDVVTEVICDKVHLCPEMIRLVFKVRPLETIALITDSIAASWLEDGDYTLGGLAVRVEGGAARLVKGGNLAGSTLKFNVALKNVHEVTGLPLKDIIRTTSLNQAAALGLDRLGKLEPGFTADVAILDADFAPAAVFVDGEQRYP